MLFDDGDDDVVVLVVVEVEVEFMQPSWFRKSGAVARLLLLWVLVLYSPFDILSSKIGVIIGMFFWKCGRGR